MDNKEFLQNLVMPVKTGNYKELLEEAETLSIQEPTLYLRNLHIPLTTETCSEAVIKEVHNLINTEVLQDRNELTALIIHGLRYNNTVKNKLLALAKKSLPQLVEELMMLNLINYQPTTREAMDKLVIMNTKGHNRNRNWTDVLHEMLKKAEQNTGALYEHYITDKCRNTFYNLIKNNTRGEYADRLLEILQNNTWREAERILKTTITLGEEYRKTRKSKEYARGTMLEIEMIFGEYYVPLDPYSLHFLHSFVNNFFGSSRWRNRIRLIIKYYLYHKEKNTLHFITCKDKSMVLRGVAGGDCSSMYHSHLKHPATAFYRILLLNEWIGYVTLIPVKTITNHKAILIDVFNIHPTLEKYDIDFTGIMDGFFDGFIANSGLGDYSYILIAEDPHKFSNRDTGNLYYKLREHPRIKGPLEVMYSNNEYGTEEYDRDLQSLSSENYIIARDVETLCKGALPFLYI